MNKCEICAGTGIMYDLSNTRAVKIDGLTHYIARPRPCACTMPDMDVVKDEYPVHPVP